MTTVKSERPNGFSIGRIYACCKACGSVVYREPGARHGDGQVDSDDNPVWLLGDGEVEPEYLPVIACGCND